MDHPHEPIDAINDWQIWYRNNNNNKMSKEKPPVYPAPNWNSFWTKSEVNKEYKQKAIEHFADTLAEYANELSADEFYDAFLLAAEEAAEYAKTEYEKTQRLVGLIKKEIK